MARDAGDISSLFPEGVTRLIDLPFTIFNLISNALVFISYEELPKEERPRKAIWFDKDRMDEHWRMVEAMREEKMKGHGETSRMPRNSLIDQLVVGR
jgi:hypothetical protein